VLEAVVLVDECIQMVELDIVAGEGGLGPPQLRPELSHCGRQY
jgi:hypothetical protein